MMVPPFCLVVFVHGMEMEADEQPLPTSRKVIGVSRMALNIGEKSLIDLTVVSPRRRHPKKVTRATAQIATSR